MNTSLLTYSVGDPVPSGCTPYFLISQSGKETWYTTCERPLPTKTPTPSYVVPVQQTQAYTTASLGHMAPFNPSAYYANSDLFSVFAFLPTGITLVIIIFLVSLMLYGVSRYYLVRKKLASPHTLLLVKPLRSTTETALATEQLFGILHARIGQKTWWDTRFQVKKSFSVELVATRNEGIRYLIHTTKESATGIQKTLLSYLPGIAVEEVSDYLPEKSEEVLTTNPFLGLFSYYNSQHFSIPLELHTQLLQHDPIAYLTGTMTKLKNGELVSLQFVLSPVSSSSNRSKTKEAKKILTHLWQGRNIDALLFNDTFASFLFLPIKALFFVLYWIFYLFFGLLSYLISLFYNSANSRDMFAFTKAITKQETKKFVPSPTQQALYDQIKEKLRQPLFETSMRLLVIADSTEQLEERVNAITASLATFDNAGDQQLLIKQPQLLFYLPQIVQLFLKKSSLFFFKNRLLGYFEHVYLSTSELASIYHLPYTATTKTEDLVTQKAKDLPTPLSLKQQQHSLDVVFAKNTYGGDVIPIGLIHEDRRRHMAIFGQSGTGKSTLLSSMINQDILNGKGLCVIDPHGQLADETLLSIAQAKREADVVWFNPDDLQHLIAINIMEQTPGLSHFDALREREFICESIISLFRKVFSDSFSSNPHRIESILRNTIHTAFVVEDATLFTIYDLLTDPTFRAQTISKLTDKRLQNFWKNMFGKAGSWQQVKMIAPVTSRIERFLFSPTTRGMLDHKHSSISIQEIMDSGKMLVCNLSKGKLGEDTSQLLGLLMLTKIQLATLARSRIPEENRRDFYLYVDEFQNFATHSFVQMLSEARKYHLNIIVAEQTTAQQKDRQITNMLFANTATVITFKTASLIDEEMILPHFTPLVTLGEIHNLPAYHFYMKLGGLTPEPPFSGVTVPLSLNGDAKGIGEMISLSNKKYTVAELGMDEDTTKPLQTQIKMHTRTIPTKREKTHESLRNKNGGAE